MIGLGKLVKKKPDYSGLKNRTCGEEVEISKNYFFFLRNVAVKARNKSIAEEVTGSKRDRDGTFHNFICPVIKHSFAHNEN